MKENAPEVHLREPAGQRFRPKAEIPVEPLADLEILGGQSGPHRLDRVGQIRRFDRHAV